MSARDGHIKIVLIGEGPPLARIISKVAALENCALSCVFSDEFGDEKVAALYGAPVQCLPGKAIKASDSLDLLKEVAADWLLSINNFDYLIPADILDLYGENTMNMHLGLLPAYAGRHAYLWAMINGESETGVTLHSMNNRFDSGDIFAIEHVEIAPQATGFSVFRQCLNVGIQLCETFLDQLCSGESLSRMPQDLSQRHAYRSRDIPDGEINLNSAAQDVYNFIRAADFTPFGSPSYTPNYHGYTLGRAQLGEEIYDQNDAGSVILIDGQAGIICADHRAVLIGLIKRGDEIVSPDEFCEKVSVS